MSVVPELEYLNFPKHYEYAVVLAGETKEIYTLTPDAGYVAFIERIACDWFCGIFPPATHSVLKLVIDGVPREFRYEIPINNPTVLNPPYVARNSIKWIVTNNDVAGLVPSGKMQDGSHWYGCLLDGSYARPKV
jgi:hypothetical protein